MQRQRGGNCRIERDGKTGGSDCIRGACSISCRGRLPDHVLLGAGQREIVGRQEGEPFVGGEREAVAAKQKERCNPATKTTSHPGLRAVRASRKQPIKPRACCIKCWSCMVRRRRVAKARGRRTRRLGLLLDGLDRRRLDSEQFRMAPRTRRPACETLRTAVD